MNIGESQPKPLRPVFAPPEAPPQHDHHHHHHHAHEARHDRHDHFDAPGNDWENQVPGQQPVPLPPGAAHPEMTDGQYVTDLYKQLLGREPDPEGYHLEVSALERGASREQVRQAFLASPEFAARLVPKPVSPAAPVAPAAAPPPITIDTVKDAAREYLAQHPEIANEPSYVNTAAVAQLREGVIAILNNKGYKAGRVLGPDGKPYDQVVAFGNANDPQAQPYRVTAGGGPIHEAITVGYTDASLPWADVH
ncbi:MAG: hypothetical protein JWM80_5370 [Cyanobacteria bacterium RYN_339]|nr:hypothetical protein [Cyanobacteria bacterium RYN_339]